MDFFEHQEKARKKSRLLTLLFLLSISFIIFSLEYFIYLLNIDTAQNFFSFLKTKTAVISALLIIFWILIASIYSMLKRRKNNKMLLRFLNAQEIYKYKGLNPNYRKILNIVEEMAIASGTTIPRVYVLKDQPTINAFVFGKNIHLVSLVITQGLIDYLKEPAQRAVIAHEYSHIFHGDMILNYRMQSLLGGIESISQAGRKIISSSNGYRHNNKHSKNHNKNSEDDASLVVVGVVLYFIGYIGLFFSSAIRALISRQREYLADASAVQYSRNSEGICHALYTIEHQKKGSYINSSLAPNISHMCFAKSFYNKSSFEFSTHPKTDARINRIDSSFLKLNKGQEILNKKRKTYTKENRKIDIKDLTGAAIFAFFLKNSKKTDQGNYAQSLIKLIPKDIQDNLHDTNMANRIVLALVLGDNKEQSKEKLAYIQSKIEPSEYQHLLKLKNKLQPNLKKIRLVLLNLVIPTLQALDKKQQINLINFINKIISVDKKIDFVEFCLITLIKKSILDNDSSYKRSCSQFSAVKKEILQCSSFLITNEQNNKKDLLENLSKNLLIKFEDSEIVNSKELYTAIIRLNTLIPVLKKQLIFQWYQILFEQLTPNQRTQDAFRLICLCLEVPIALER